MNRIKYYALTLAALFAAQFSPGADASSAPQDASNNEVLNRIARIQQESQSQNKTPEFLHNQQISQWYNWPNWNNWNNWPNWYNY